MSASSRCDSQLGKCLPFTDHLEANLQLGLQVLAVGVLPQHTASNTPWNKLIVVLHAAHNFKQLLRRVPEIKASALRHSPVASAQ
jgi:hypothetical protein